MNTSFRDLKNMVLNPDSCNYLLWDLEISNSSSLSLFAYLGNEDTYNLTFSMWWGLNKVSVVTPAEAQNRHGNTTWVIASSMRRASRTLSSKGSVVGAPRGHWWTRNQKLGLWRRNTNQLYNPIGKQYQEANHNLIKEMKMDTMCFNQTGRGRQGKIILPLGL